MLTIEAIVTDKETGEKKVVVNDGAAQWAYTGRELQAMLDAYEEVYSEQPSKLLIGSPAMSCGLDSAE